MSKAMEIVKTLCAYINETVFPSKLENNVEGEGAANDVGYIWSDVWTERDEGSTGDGANRLPGKSVYLAKLPESGGEPLAHEKLPIEQLECSTRHASRRLRK